MAPVRAREYGVPIFRLASSGISQAVKFDGQVVTRASFPGGGEILSARLKLPGRGELPWDRYFAPFCVAATAAIAFLLLWQTWREKKR